MDWIELFRMPDSADLLDLPWLYLWSMQVAQPPPASSVPKKAYLQLKKTWEITMKSPVNHHKITIKSP